MDQRGRHQEGDAELGFHHLAGAPPVGLGSELVLVGRRIGGDRDPDDRGIAAGQMVQSQLTVQVKGSIDDGVGAAATGIRLETQLVAPELVPEVVCDGR